MQAPIRCLGGVSKNEKTVIKAKPLKRLRAAHNDAYRELVLKL